MRKAEAFKTESLAFAEKVQAVNHYDETRWLAVLTQLLMRDLLSKGRFISRSENEPLTPSIFFN